MADISGGWEDFTFAVPLPLPGDFVTTVATPPVPQLQLPPPLVFPKLLPPNVPAILMVYNDTEQQVYIEEKFMAEQSRLQGEDPEQHYDVPDRIRWIREAIQYLRQQLGISIVEWNTLSNLPPEVLGENLLDLKLTIGMPQDAATASLVPAVSGPAGDLPDRSHPGAAFSAVWACLAGLDDKARHIWQLVQFRHALSEADVPQSTVEQRDRRMQQLLVAQQEVARPVVFAAVRPPGHHALYAPNGARGFCFFPNALVMATRAIRKYSARVFVLDIDFHYGLGSDVLTQLINFAFQSAHFSILPHPQSGLLPCSEDPHLSMGAMIGYRNVYRSFCQLFAERHASYSYAQSGQPIEELPVAYMSYHADTKFVYDAPLQAKTTARGLIHPYLLVDDTIAGQRNVIRREASLWNTDFGFARSDLRRQLMAFLAGSLPDQQSYIIVSAGFDAAATDHIGLSYDSALEHARHLWKRHVYREIARVLNEVITDPGSGNVGLVSILEGGYHELSIKCSGVYSYLAELANIPAAVIQDPICHESNVLKRETTVAEEAVQAAAAEARRKQRAPPSVRRISSAAASSSSSGRFGLPPPLPSRSQSAASSTRSSVGARPLLRRRTSTTSPSPPNVGLESEEGYEIKLSEEEIFERNQERLRAVAAAERERRQKDWVDVAGIELEPRRRRARPAAVPRPTSAFSASTAIADSPAFAPSPGPPVIARTSSLSASLASPMARLHVAPSSPPRSPPAIPRFDLPPHLLQPPPPVSLVARSAPPPQTGRRRISIPTWQRMAESAFQRSVEHGRGGYLTAQELETISLDFIVSSERIQTWLVSRIEQYQQEKQQQEEE